MNAFAKCASKRSFDTRAEAQAFKSARRATHGGSVGRPRVYWCALCGKYHFGRKR